MFESTFPDAKGRFAGLDTTLDERDRIKRATTTKDLILMAKIASPNLAAAVNADVELARSSLAALKALKTSPNLTLTAELALDLCVERIEHALANPPGAQQTMADVLSEPAVAAIRDGIERRITERLSAMQQTRGGQAYAWFHRDDFARIERELSEEIVAPLVRDGQIRGATFGIGYDRQHKLAVGTVVVQP